MPRIAKRALGGIVPAFAAMTLAGCTASVAPATYSAPQTAPVPPGWAYRNGGYYAPPPVVAPVPAPDDARPPARRSFIPPAQAETRQPVDPPPLRLPVAGDAPGPRFLPPVTLLTPPADATDCTGWWRICHLY
jgi:hypothetical protein